MTQSCALFLNLYDSPILCSKHWNHVWPGRQFKPAGCLYGWMEASEGCVWEPALGRPSQAELMNAVVPSMAHLFTYKCVKRRRTCTGTERERHSLSNHNYQKTLIMFFERLQPWLWLAPTHPSIAFVFRVFFLLEHHWHSLHRTGSTSLKIIIVDQWNEPDTETNLTVHDAWKSASAHQFPHSDHARGLELHWGCCQ